MKPLLLHGSAIVSSRNKLVDLKKAFQEGEVITWDGGSSFEEMVAWALTVPLFSPDRLLLLENPPDNFDPDSLSQTPGLTVIVWFGKEVDGRSKLLKWFEKNGQVLHFPEAKELSAFPLLDLLAAKEREAFVKLHELESNSKSSQVKFDVYYLINMTYYLLHSLVATPKNVPVFVRQKLQRQRRGYTQADLANLYQSVLQIEFKLKQGLIEESQAKFLLVNQFTDLK